MPERRARNHRGSLLRLLVLFGTLLLGVLALPAVAATGSNDAGRAGASSTVDPGPTHSATVTLVSGDRIEVTWTQKGDYSAAPLSQRVDAAGLPVTFQTLSTPNGDLYVIPSDAGQLIAAGRLDRELFNVRKLVEDRRTDAETRAVPVIVQFSGRRARTAGPKGLAERGDDLPATRAVRPLESIDAAGLEISKAGASRFWDSIRRDGSSRRAATTLTNGIAKVWLDGRVQAALHQSVQQIGAPEAWAAGYDGTGVRVAVLDTGIDATHPDVAGKVDLAASFVPSGTTKDGNGHGTHVASTIAGSGAASDGLQKGVAPGAHLIIGKVLNDSGFGNDSWIIDGMEWAAEHDASVVNMSLGTEGPADATDPMSLAVDRLTDTTGTLFVIAAGNIGPGSKTIGSPGSAASALTVGAVDKQDTLAGFSSRGPVIESLSLKPDITAPGVNIVAARAAGTSLGSPVDEYYTSLSGTSMATPHVAGSAAILAQEHPDWSPAELKGALTGSAAAVSDDPVYAQGSGRVDVPEAIEQTLVAQPSSIDFARIGPERSDPVTRATTLHNLGDHDLTLDLSAEIEDSQGKPAGDRFTLTPGKVTIPAGGDADVTVTYQPEPGQQASYSGMLTATGPGGDRVLRVAIGAQQAPPEHQLTLRPIPPKGWPIPGVVAEFENWYLYRVDAPGDVMFVSRTLPTATVVVPDGVYAVGTAFRSYDPDTGDYTVTALADPEVVVRGADQEVTVDARDARPIRVETELPNEAYYMGEHLVRTTAYGGAYVQSWLTMSDGAVGRQQLAVTPTEPVEVGSARSVVQAMVRQPAVTMRVDSHPEVTLRPAYLNARFQEPKLDGVQRLELVDVGSGTPAEIEHARVAGRLALVTLPDSNLAVNQDGSPYRKVLDDLRAAGAAAAVLAPEVGTPRWCPPPLWWADSCAASQRLPLPVMRIGQGGAAGLHNLLADGKVGIVVRSTPRVSYVYDLRFDHPGGVGNSTYTVAQDQLATSVQRFHASSPTDLMVQSTSFDTDGLRLLNELEVPAPSVLTRYVGPVDTPVARSVWARGYSVTERRNRDAWSTVTPSVDETVRRLVREPGGSVVDWNLPYTVGAPDWPRDLATGDWAHLMGLDKHPWFSRDASHLRTYTALLPSARDHAGPWIAAALIDPSKGEAHLYRDGEEVTGTGGAPLYFDLSDHPEPATYRYELSLKSPVGAEGPRQLRSNWTFTSGRPAGNQTWPAISCWGQEDVPVADQDCRVEPLLMLGYELGPVLDLHNRARPGRIEFRVRGYHEPGAPNPPTVDLRAEVSYDHGASWAAAQTSPDGDGGFRVSFTPKAGGRSDQWVSLRVRARDAAGSRVSQTLVDVFRVAAPGSGKLH